MRKAIRPPTRTLHGIVLLGLVATAGLLSQLSIRDARADGLPAYQKITLTGAIPGQFAFASGLNESGAISGATGQSNGNDQAFRVLAPANGAVPASALLSHLPGGDFSDAFDINDAGDVCGGSRATGTTTSVGRAAAWRAGSSTPIDLGTLGGAGSRANALSNSGIVVGFSDTPTGFSAFRYDLNAPSPAMQALDLGPVLGGGASAAYDISPDGAFIVGSARATGTGGNFVPFIQFSGATIALPMLPGTESGTPLAVNNNGEIGGSCAKPGGGTIACVWTKSPEGQYIVNPVPGIPPDSSFSFVLGINIHGDYVGNILGPSPGFARSAFGLIRGALVPNLDALLGTRAVEHILTAEAIDSRAQIAGTLSEDGQNNATILRIFASSTPDLAGTIAVSSTRVTQGGTIQVEFTVKNNGPGLADGYFVRLPVIPGLVPTRVVSPGGVLSTLGDEVQLSQLGPLSEGRTAKITVTYSVAADASAGVRVITARVLQLGDESNPENNLAATTVEVEAAPSPGAADLSLKGPTNPIVVAAGKTATFAFGVVNLSRINAAIQQALQIQIPGELRIDSVKAPQGSTMTREGGTITVSGTMLAKGKTETTQVKVTAVTPTTGTSLFAGVTATNPDSTPGNNTYSANVMVSGPDLTVQLDKVDQKKPASSRMVSIAGKFVNKGKGGTSTGVSGRVVLVKPGGETTVLGPLTGGSIGPNGSRPFKGNFTLPKGVDPATAMIRVEVDPENEIPEDNEANNSAQKSIKLLPPGR